MKKIILSILLLSGLLLAIEVTEENANKETFNQITAPLVNDSNINSSLSSSNINKEINSSLSSKVSYIVDADGTINLKIDLISEPDDFFNNMTIKELKEMVTSLKKDNKINKVLLDSEFSTVNEFKENLLLKKELAFEKNKVQILSDSTYKDSKELEQLRNMLKESEDNIKDIRKSIAESSIYLLCLVFSLGVIGTLYIQLEIAKFRIKIEKEQLPVSHYILNYGLKIFFGAFVLLLIIGVIKHI